MICSSALYPNETGKKFDIAYYMDKHIPLVHRKFDPLGLAKLEVEKGICGTAENDPPPFVVMVHMYFNSMDDFNRCMTETGELFADIPNFTDIQPRFQLSEVV